MSYQEQGRYTTKMYGPIITEAPPGFVPYQNWEEYQLPYATLPIFQPKWVGQDPKGFFRGIWPMFTEEYISDMEPILADSDPTGTAPSRLLIWQRVFRTDIPPGWNIKGDQPSMLGGFATLNSPDFRRNWSESARRYVKKWHIDFKGTHYRVIQLPAEEFIKHYRRATLPLSQKMENPGEVRRRLAHGAKMEFWCVQHIATGEIAAGMATIPSPSNNGSYYLHGLLVKKYSHDPLMEGLMDHWHERCFAANIRYLHFGHFWQPGESSDSKGFSMFKAKFGLEYISYQPRLFKSVRGRLF